VRSVLESAARRFVAGEHLRNVYVGDWLPLHAEDGSVLPGIRGRVGATAVTQDGHEIGVDLIHMDRGSAFPLHVHPGDHILYIVSGGGCVHIDGDDRQVMPGDSVFIAAEHPHGVKAGTATHLRFLAFGHPHKHLEAADRMRLVHGHGGDAGTKAKGPHETA
jgi:quercetin dioxygenase-like cupin family protein